MPPKDTESREFPAAIQNSTLFYSTDDGVTYKPVGQIVEVPELLICDDEHMVTPLITGGEMTFTMEARFNRNMLLVLIGRASDVPNNWLRMHGFPMHKRLKRGKKTR